MNACLSVVVTILVTIVSNEEDNKYVGTVSSGLVDNANSYAASAKEEKA